MYLTGVYPHWRSAGLPFIQLLTASSLPEHPESCAQMTLQGEASVTPSLATHLACGQLTGIAALGEAIVRGLCTACQVDTPIQPLSNAWCSCRVTCPFVASRARNAHRIMVLSFTYIQIIRYVCTLIRAALWQARKDRKHACTARGNV